MKRAPPKTASKGHKRSSSNIGQDDSEGYDYLIHNLSNSNQVSIN